MAAAAIAKAHGSYTVKNIQFTAVMPAIRKRLADYLDGNVPCRLVRAVGCLRTAVVVTSLFTYQVFYTKRLSLFDLAGEDKISHFL